jgi:hypothetical protein
MAAGTEPARERDVLYVGAGSGVGCPHGCLEPVRARLDCPPGEYPGESARDARAYPGLADPEWRLKLSLDAPTELEFKGTRFRTPRSLLVYLMFREISKNLKKGMVRKESKFVRISREMIESAKARREDSYLVTVKAPKRPAVLAAERWTAIVQILKRCRSGEIANPFEVQASYFGQPRRANFREGTWAYTTMREDEDWWWKSRLFRIKKGETTSKFDVLSRRVRSLQFADDPGAQKLLLATGKAVLQHETPRLYDLRPQTTRDLALEKVRAGLAARSPER